MLSIGREIAGASFPFGVGNPFEIFRSDVEESDILVAAFLVGSDEQGSAVFRERGRGIQDRTLMRREISRLASSDVDGVNISVSETYLQTVRVESFAVRAPGDRSPKMIGRAFVSQQCDFV